MTKGILFILVNLFLSQTLVSQSCLTSGITFTTQQRIDSFPITYPGCHSIDGFVTIDGPDIFNLDSLSVITAVKGVLTIQNTTHLSSLNGLHNVSTLGGNVNLLENKTLNDLSAFSLVDTIGGGLFIQSNDQLKELTGFESVKRIKGDLHISRNPELLSLAKFTQLKSVVGNINIIVNRRLKHLYGLEGITFQLGDIKILYNDSLLDYHGFDNLSILRGKLTIDNNPMAVDFSGFGALRETADLIIEKTACKNLNGFNQLAFVRGTLEFGINPNLETLDGMDSLTQIGSWLHIARNDKLINLQGLEHLEKIGGLIIENNDVLVSAQGLNGLKTIESSIRVLDNPKLQEIAALIGASGVLDRITISDNELLQSLYGLDNLCNSPILEVIIEGNPNLTLCNTECICAHLIQGGANTIEGNKPGCNTREEIVTACLVKTNDPGLETRLRVSPNPTFDLLEIKGLGSTSFQYSIHDVYGTLKMHGYTHGPQIDLSNLSSGLYILMIETDNKITSHRIVKQ